MFDAMNESPEDQEKVYKNRARIAIVRTTEPSLCFFFEISCAIIKNLCGLEKRCEVAKVGSLSAGEDASEDGDRRGSSVCRVTRKGPS